ncbi:MAG: hypothetical protein KJ871_04245 [Alphaproteobacteria bacterium]|nr:hypothetical protein [Alphaproteobacteria bacterium]MBU2082608.1 hypothetical protein [Alphaproteobacteria bacterium]MBU2142752.1 hypothetical protein [Alphaproteobacteria bacterium]MBU2195174.1 hypothetical protein [Alphaproteobacteria bacterium]
MNEARLKSAKWSYLNTVGIIRDPPGIPPLKVRGIHGGSEFTVGLLINGVTVERLPGESVDDLTARVRRDELLRGDAANEAVTLYEPAVEPKRIEVRR